MTMSTSTNNPVEPQQLEEDLTREVEDANIAEEMDMDLSDFIQEMESEDVTQQQSTNTAQTTKKVRSRRSSQHSDSPDEPKRRKTSPEEEEPIAGPSSSILQQSKTIVSEDKESVSDDSDRDSEDSGLFDENDGQNILNLGKENPEMNFEQEYLGRMHHDLTSSLKVNEDIHFSPNISRSAGLEELFYLPIYESDMRPTLATDRKPATQNAGKEVSFPANEKQRMMWARKMLFLSTDLIFPGFTDASTDKFDRRKQYTTTRVRSSWALQALLYADALLFAMWVLSFFCTIDISMSVLKELHGNLVLCMTILFIVVNVPRLIFGFRGNERDKLELLALFWMTTFIVQGPLLGFILFTDVFTPVRLAFTIAMDSFIMMFLLLEFIVGSYHLRALIRDELKIIKLLKLSENLIPNREDHSLRTNDYDMPIRFSDQEDLENEPPELDNDEDWTTDEEKDGEMRRALGRPANVNYRMRIRRLAPEPEDLATNQVDESMDEDQENDDTNLVTSTSDAIRHRSVRVN